MEMPLGDIIDRYSILRLKKERLSLSQKEAEPLIDKELAAYTSAIEEFRIKGFKIKQEWIDDLYRINGKCWDKEADIRQGKENELGLEEVGRRTLLLRDYNKERIAVKNMITKESGSGYPEIKINHASEVDFKLNLNPSQPSDDISGDGLKNKFVSRIRVENNGSVTIEFHR